MTDKQRNNLRWTLVQLLRLLLAAVFIFSGAVKLIDPHGTEYKILDYAAAFGMRNWLVENLALYTGLLLAATEFVLGLRMLLAIKTRSTAIWMACFLLVMTPLTLYIWITGVVVDCGCFGEALHLSNAQTFLKNVVLLGAVSYVILNHERVHRLCSRFTQWWMNIGFWFFAFYFAALNLHGLPMVDFRPFRIGTDLNEARVTPGADPMLSEFFMYDSQADDFVEEEFLAAPGYKMLVTLPRLDQSEEGMFDRMDTLSAYCRRYGYPFYALTSSNRDAIDYWIESTDAQYTFCESEYLTLKTMARSNPALILLKDGTIVGKWSSNELPKDEQLNAPIEQLKWARQTASTRTHQMYWIFACLALLCAVAFAVDYVGRKGKKAVLNKRNQKQTISQTI